MKKQQIKFSEFQVEDKRLDRFALKKSKSGSCEAWFRYE